MLAWECRLWLRKDSALRRRKCMQGGSGWYCYTFSCIKGPLKRRFEIGTLYASHVGECSTGTCTDHILSCNPDGRKAETH